MSFSPFARLVAQRSSLVMATAAFLLFGCGGGGGGGGTPVGSSNPVPSITSVSPGSVTAGSSPFTLTVNGSGFVSTSTVEWNGSTLTTSYVSSTQLTATVTAGDIASAGSASVTVISPSPGGGTSSGASVTITSNNPVPQLTQISPQSVTAGGSGFTLGVAGTGFVSSSVVKWNGSALSTTYISDTALIASVPASDIASTGTANVTVTSPSPGGGTSSAQTFSINSTNPAPQLAALSPTSATAGGAMFTLAVGGYGFVNTSTVQWNGSALTTNYYSDSYLTATVPASLIASSGTASITINTPSPGGGTSTALTFTINPSNPAPTISSLSPNAATAGGGAFSLAVSGSGFVSSSVVNWNGSALTTTYGSSTQLTASVPASDIASAGSASVTVTNPSPGGGTSSGAGFTISGSGAAGAPGAPTNVVAYAGDAPTTAYVLFAAPSSNGGSAITSFTATASNGQTATSTTLTVPNGSGGSYGSGLPRRVDFSGLPNQSLTFTVTASNANGTGPTSVASNAVTPAAYSDYYICCGGGIAGLNPQWSGAYSFNANYTFWVPSANPPSSVPTNPVNAANGVVQVNPTNSSGYELQLFVVEQNPTGTTHNGAFNSSPFNYITFQVYPPLAGLTLNFPAWETTFNFEGVVTSGTNTSNELTDSTLNWPSNQFPTNLTGVFDRTTQGAGGYTGNTGTTISDTGMNTAPGVGDHYYVQVGDISVGITLNSLTSYVTAPNAGQYTVGAWNTIKIPLSAFQIGSVDNNILYKFHVGIANYAGPVYFANIAFTKN